jgi:hypothetical protein
MVVQLHDALYPQYNLVGRVQEFITEYAPWLAEQAAAKLAEDEKRQGGGFAVPSVKAHWRALATTPEASHE